jgi:hypothetical protein
LEPLRRSHGRRLFAPSFALLAIALLAACAAPSGVEKISSLRAQWAFNDSLLSTGKLGANARILLHRIGQRDAWKDDPAEVLAYLHFRLLIPSTEFTAGLRMSLLNGMAELAFSHATKSGDRRYFLAAAMYAWVYKEQIRHRLDSAQGRPSGPRLTHGLQLLCAPETVPLTNGAKPCRFDAFSLETPSFSFFSPPRFSPCLRPSHRLVLRV